MSRRNRSANVNVVSDIVSDIETTEIGNISETLEPVAETLEPVAETLEPVAETLEPVAETPEDEDEDEDEDESGANAVGKDRNDTAGSDIVWIPIGQVMVDREFNIRDLEAYEKESLEELIANIKTFGLKDPLEVCLEKGTKGVLDHYLTLRGNRRWTACNLINEEYYKDCEKRGIPPTNPPYPKLPCRVLKNLSNADKVIQMLDQGNVKRYKPTEIYRAVKRLVDLRWSETDIMGHLGLTRGETSPHFNAAKLPDNVQETYARYLKADKKTRIKESIPTMDRQTVLDLRKAQKADMKHNTSSFTEKWKEVQSKEAGKGGRKGTLLAALNDEKGKVVGHRKFADYIQCLIGATDEDLERLPDLRESILQALKEVYPIEPIKIIEGNVTRTN